LPANWTFGKRLAFGFAVAVLTLIVIAISGYQSTQTLIENDRVLTRTQRALGTLDELLLAVTEAETAYRGYVITGLDDRLQPFAEAGPKKDRALSDLGQLLSESPLQLRRLDALRLPIDGKLAFLRESIDIRKTKGFEAAAARSTGGEGKRSMDQIRGIIREIDATEKDSLARRSANAEASAQRAQAVMAWGSGLGVLVIALVGLYIARSLSSQIASAVRRIQSSSAELQSASNQQATGAREQSTAMNEISTTITELLATSRQIAESSQRVAQIAEQTAASARAGDVTVRRGSDSVGGIRRQVEVIVNHMLDLGKKSQQIGSVLDIVSELAEQTNILAINATIEAAGAGEAGKRFGVVADEIRKLADRVAGSTKEIRGLIDDVRSAVNTTVMTTETGSKAVEAGANQFADVAAAFSQIAAQVTTTMEAAKEIGLSTKQQTTAVEQVNLAIANVTQATKETEVSTGQTLQTASELSGLSRDLLRIVEAEGGARVQAA
jgi:methyl-accepting chemotaxis protein